MYKRVCDICKKNEANKSLKAKRSTMIGWNRGWTPYEKIDMCQKCYEELFSVAEMVPPQRR